LDHGFTDFRQLFVVLAESAVSPEPRKGPLDNPAFRKNGKPSGGRIAPNQRPDPPEHAVDKPGRRPGVAFVCKDHLEPWSLPDQTLEQMGSDLAVVEISAMDENGE